MKFYSLDKVISYNIPVNIIITERGYGKSYSVKDYVIKEYIKRNKKFLYLRRYENEIKEIFEGGNSKDNPKEFFDDFKEKYSDHKLKAKNRKFYIDDNVFGYAKRMTEAQDLKSSNYSQISTIIIDEYPIEKGQKRYYLQNEGMIILGIFDSIFRNKSSEEVKIFILGNAVEGLEYSPLFTFLNISLPYEKDIRLFKDNTILVQYAKDSEFRKERQKTFVGKISKDTPYEEYAINNKILDKNNDFIEKKKSSSIFSFAFVYNKEYYGVWNDFKESKIYISKDYDKSCPYIYAVTTNDFKPNTLLIRSASKNRQWKFLIENYKLGLVYFENQRIKKYSQDVIRMFLTS